jgi:hypothetical protein
LETGALPLELLPYVSRLPAGLLGLFMYGDRIAPLAELVELDPLGIVTLVLHGGVVTALALLASHRDPDPHYFTYS